MSAEFDKMLADDTEYRRLPQGELPAGEVDGEKESATDVADTTDTSNNKNDEIKPEFSWKYIFYLLKKGFVRYFIDAFTGMAQGLFCTLIAGTILGQIGAWITSAGTDAALIVGGAPPSRILPRCSWARASA